MMMPTSSSTEARTKRAPSFGHLLSSVAVPRSFLRDDSGSVTAFSLFMFLMMLFVGGMAVDLMRFETKRAALQNTLDAASLAATNLRSEADAKQLVKDVMTKRGYDGNLVHVQVDETYTGADPETNDPGTLVARSVTADYDLVVDTLFMPLLGFETLGTAAAGAAEEGMTSVEISLVVDISNSMNSEGRLADLKTAATNFVTQVMASESATLPVTISVVPFNHTVVAPTEILSRLNVQDDISIPAVDHSPYGIPVTSYKRTAPESQCVRFEDAHMITGDLQEELEPTSSPNYLALRGISRTAELDLMGYYARYYGGGGWNGTGVPPNDNYWRCNPDYYPAILPWATDSGTLTTYITGMTAHGNTSADTGLKWGVAMLDPAFRTVVSDMITAGDLPQAMSGRPYDYDPARFMKVVVLMSDGANTVQHDLSNTLKNGPSTIWRSEKASKDTGDEGQNWVNEYIVDTNDDGIRDREKQWYDGYYILREDYPESERWLRPHSLTDLSDGELYAANELPDDAVQMTWDEVFERFSVGHAGLLHYDSAVSGAYNAWYNLYYGDQWLIDNVNDGEADRRMSGDDLETEHGLCDAAKVKNDILIFTIAFKAGTDAENVLRDCATSDGYAFNASNGEALNQAFSTIATTLTTLRMTQ